MASNIEVPIFTHTNLGTRIAVSVPPDIAARDFKRKLETVHSKCFPESGEIEIDGLMVKRKSFYYHLTDSVPMKHAFEGVQGTWFLHVEARTSSQCFEPYVVNPMTVDKDRVSNASSITEPFGPTDSVTSDTKGKTSLDGRTRLVYVSRKKRRKEREMEKCFVGYKVSGDEAKFLGAGSENVAFPANKSYDHQHASRSVTEVPTEMFSEVKSVTSIIRRYFPNSNEKTGFTSPTSSEATSRRRKTKRDRSCSSVKPKSFSEVANQIPSCFLRSPLLINASEKTLRGTSDGTAEVGERLVTATNNLGLFSSKKKSAIHLCRKATHREAASLIRLSVFDISDSDD